ncbi:MAG: AmmeMemoRadiSam system protein B [Proteobacteria bacterium]|nr:AmmeMemoRadiSam system protein B [Pseudomonadota bacterium]
MDLILARRKGVCVLLVLLTACVYAPCFVMFSWAGEEGKMSKGTERVVRKAFGAGRWFPGSGKELKTMVDGYIETARVDKVNGRIVGAIAPHAGYAYSGKVAGYAFRAIRDNAETWGRPETVVVLGVSHRSGFPGVALMDGDAIGTPLGEAVLDKEGAELLAAKSPRIYFDYRPHAGEHSAENEIPFVQRALPGTSLIVGLIGDHDPQTLNELMAVLDTLSRKKRIVVIASSDMLHDPNYERVTKTDRDTLEMMRVMDHAGIEKDWSYSRQTFCGIGPVLAVMRFAELKGCKKGTVLHYRNSGDDFPESRGRWVVGYGSAVFAAPE